MEKDTKLRKFIVSTICKYLNESTNNEIKVLKKQLKDLDNWFYNHSYGKSEYESWEEKAKEANAIRRKLYQLTGDPYGETKNKTKKNIKPSGLNNRYDDPRDVPKEVYRWILQNTSLLTTDATDV